MNLLYQAMSRSQQRYEKRVGYKSIIDLGREATVPFPHNLYDYPTKILPQVIVNAVLYVLVISCKSQSLLHDLPPWKAVN